MGVVPAADSNAAYGRFWIDTDGTLKTRLPSGLDWVAAEDPHTHVIADVTGLQAELNTVSDHGNLAGLGDDDHSQYHNNTRGDARYYTQTQLSVSGGGSAVHWDNVTNVPATFTPSAHTHDDRYYTETELNTSGAGGAVHWDNVTSKPPTFTPSAHTHTASEVTDFDVEVSNNVDVAANTTHRGIVTGNPHNVTSSEVGLGNVPNVDATLRANHTGTQTASTISDFDVEVSSNADVAANTTDRHTHANKANLDTINQDLATDDAVTFLSVTAHRPIVSFSGTAKTLALADANTFQDCSNALDQTVTIPNNATVAFPIGTEIEFFRAGAGNVTFAKGAGVTTQSRNDGLSINSQYGAVVIKKKAADTWVIIGDVG